MYDLIKILVLSSFSVCINMVWRIKSHQQKVINMVKSALDIWLFLQVIDYRYLNPVRNICGLWLNFVTFTRNKYPLMAKTQYMITRMLHRLHHILMSLMSKMNQELVIITSNPDSKVHGANMGPTWVLSAPDGPQVGPTNLAIREYLSKGWWQAAMFYLPCLVTRQAYPDSKVHGANMGPIWGRQDPGGPILAPWTLLSG